MTARDKQKALVEHGIAANLDEAAHMLVDMGDIDSTTHEELLSDEEAARVYGSGALESGACLEPAWGLGLVCSVCGTKVLKLTSDVDGSTEYVCTTHGALK